MIRLSAGVHAAALGAAALDASLAPAMLGVLAGNHAALAAIGMMPRTHWLGPNLHRLPHPGAAVALTFDDGPDPAVTPRVLDLLAEAGATASFFCVGCQARAHPALLRRIVAAGHTVENHSATHPNHFAFLLGAALRREVEGAQAVLADLAGTPPRWFRAPMGFRGPPLEPALLRAGLHLASWSRRGLDTRCGDPARVLARLTRALAPGDILLLHDRGSAPAADGQPVVLAVLPRLLTALRRQGLSATALPGGPAAAAGAPGSPA